MSSVDTTDGIATFEQPKRGVLGTLQHWLHVNPALVPLIVLLASIVVFGLLLGSKFFSPFALTLILQQVQIVGIVAAAQSLVILTAGIDLSVGAIAVISSVVMGQFTFRYGLPVEVSIACGLIFGTAIGYVNGWLVAVMKLPPFIVGAVFTVGVLFMVLLVVLLAYALKHTAWGRHVYAVGDDPEAAELSGVNVKATLISVYAVAGLICGFAGWALIGRIGSVSPTSGQLLNIESITAVVIGGISLFGGRGSILGTFFGALIVGVFTLGLRLMGADAQWTYLLIGALIIAAVVVDQWIRKVAA